MRRVTLFAALALCFVVVIVVSWLLFAPSETALPTVRVQIGDRIVLAEVPETPEQYLRGLMGRTSLSSNEGMLFLYDPPEQPTFWMKDVPIPLDLVWISGGRVVGVTRAEADDPALSDAEKPRYRAPQFIDAVLELGADSGLQKGDSVSWEKVLDK